MKEITQEFQKLLDILERLIGPDGCPWDQEQTMQSLRYSVLEETCELIEAIDLNDDPHICEELGDLFLNATFLCRLAQKEERFPFHAVLEKLNEKLIRRHPHVFGDAQVETVDDLVAQWAEIKKQEKGERTGSVIDDIPKGLPSLTRAQKSLKRMRKEKFENLPSQDKHSFTTEDELGDLLLDIAYQARHQKLDAEHALRKRLAHLEQEFRQFELN